MAEQKDDLSFLTGVSAEYVAHLYTEFLKNSGGVDKSWQDFFSGLNDTERALLDELTGASWTPEENRKAQNAFGVTGAPVEVTSAPAQSQTGPANTQDVTQAAQDSIGALMLIRAFRARGHLEAKLDPLGLKGITDHPELDPGHYGFSLADHDRKIYIGGVLGLQEASIKEILQICRQTYCGTIGLEYLHMTDPEEKSWLQERIEEPRNKTDFTPEGKKAIFQRLVAAEGFEQFLHKKHTGTKRFGLDGGEALIPAIEQIMKRGGQLGLEEIVIGMAHRGRLNVLTNVMGKSFQAVFAEFQGHQSETDEDVQGSGDVKYHLGTSSDRDFDGHNIHLSLTANPSHLEFVNPVVIGKVRAKQKLKGDVENTATMPILLHGDAAFAGQGITAETLMISELPGYRVGGTIHVVINNQIGFTTTPKFGRSGPYCTDVAKMLSAPILHVNGDDPEAVVHVARIATEFRQKFKKDVVIDMYCYRRFGHNEGDEPAFTQPLMYQKIADQKTTAELYTVQLVSEGVLTQEEADEIRQKFMDHLNDEFEAVKDFEPSKADFFGGAWEGKSLPDEGDRKGQTGISEELFQKVGKALTTVPDGFNINRKLQRVLNAKKKMFETGEGFDWATAEGLAFGSLLDENYSVRLSGQDVGRGTFSHRHATWYDQETEQKYYPLAQLVQKDKRLEVYDSPLSEAAVLGFEYGISLSDPNVLVMWEAQFGDFVNGAQVLIDQFISSGEIKWLRMSGLTMLLPHGYEGQGPEHSSARFERFLQASAEDNWQVANCTTPANYYHILRRQMKRDFRKPLVIMTPKSLLRHKLAQSKAEEFIGEASFHRFLWDDDHETLSKNPEKIKRIVLCTGKVYFDLLQERRERKIEDVYILRLEQLYPFPTHQLALELAPFVNADIVWCQEEPKNQGAWTFVDPLIEETLESFDHKFKRAKYAGRKAAAAPATGLLSRHTAEQAKLVNEALTIDD
ncbi:MAG: 2-oxoglutarate dehydrogenase E1 component [Pseudomonadota bacterium]